MSYSVKSTFFTLQGEGARTGRPAVFCRFSGCNLWNGKLADKESAPCWFCDTDFVGTNGAGGGRFEEATHLGNHIASFWPEETGAPYVVFTGGEPLLQLDDALIKVMKDREFEIAVETNGTLHAPKGIDWITVSPKPRSPLSITRGNELKLVYPHDVAPEEVEHYEFEHYYLSPLMTADEEQNRRHMTAASQYCLQHPQWKLTHQMHKLWNIP